MKLNKIGTGMIVLTMLLVSIVLISSAMVPTEEPATLRMPLV